MHSTPTGGHKINFDSVIRDYFSSQATVCRNHLGQIVKMASQIQSNCSANTREALAARLATSLATSLYLKKKFEGDSQTIILALQQPTIVQDWRITNIIQDILNSISPKSSWSTRKVYKSTANFHVHYVVH